MLICYTCIHNLISYKVFFFIYASVKSVQRWHITRLFHYFISSVCNFMSYNNNHHTLKHFQLFFAVCIFSFMLLASILSINTTWKNKIQSNRSRHHICFKDWTDQSVQRRFYIFFFIFIMTSSISISIHEVRAYQV